MAELRRMKEKPSVNSWAGVKLHFQEILQEAQTHRPERNDWVEYERAVMHGAVNSMRDRLGLEGLPIEAIKRVEDQACGHSDYTRKFAMYCAGLATNDQPSNLSV